MTALDGKVAIVTGAASGIGKGIAIALLSRGATVVIADVEDEALHATADVLGAEGMRLDVSDAAAVSALAAEIVASHGHVDIVVNNAGVGPLQPIEQLTIGDFDWVLDVNLRGVINGVKAFLPHLRANPTGGHIVNTASMAGLINGPGMGAYSVSKFGVVALTEVLAAELAGSDIGVSVLLPARVRSRIASSARNRPGGHAFPLDDAMTDPNVPPGRMLEAEEVGELVVDGILARDLYIVTHPEALAAVQMRHDRIVAAFEDAAERESTRR